MLRYEGSGEDAIITEWVLGSQQNGGYVGGCFGVLLIHFFQTVMMEKAMDFTYHGGGTRLVMSVRSEFSCNYESVLKRVPPRVIWGAEYAGAAAKGAKLGPFSGPPPKWYLSST